MSNAAHTVEHSGTFTYLRIDGVEIARIGNYGRGTVFAAGWDSAKVRAVQLEQRFRDVTGF